MKTKPLARKKRKDYGLQKKQRMFQGIPVRDARADILVKPTQSDIDIAIRRDPEHCAYAVCLKRMLQTTRVFVYSTIAYVETADEQGRPLMERYEIRNSAYHAIEKFDRGEKMNPGGFTLHSPAPSATLEGKRRYARSLMKEPGYRERLRDYQKKWWQKKRKIKYSKVRELVGRDNGAKYDFRDGTGQVRFLGTHEGILKTGPREDT